MLYPEGTTSVTPTMLRLISSFDESDGRCVHTLDCGFNKTCYFEFTTKSILLYLLLILTYFVFSVIHLNSYIGCTLT